MKSQNNRKSLMAPQNQLNTHNYTLSHSAVSLLGAPLLNNNINNRDSLFNYHCNDTGSNDIDPYLIKHMSSSIRTMSIDEPTNMSSNCIRKDIISNNNTLQIAQEILDGTYNAISYKEYANFLGAKTNHDILVNFVKLLNPLPYSLLSVLNKLSNSLYLIAESQNMDKILEEVSKQWVEAYPKNKWGDRYQMCHIVLFSLLILNSDLHNEENKVNQNYNKFSCEEFIDNTISTIEIELNKSKDDNFVIINNFDEIKVDLTSELVSYYESLKHSALPVLKIRSNEDYINSSTDNKSYITSKRNHIKRTTSNVSTLTRNTSLSLFEKKSVHTINSQLDSQIHDFDKNKVKHLREQNFNLLYFKELFDDQLIQKRCPVWIMDTILYIYEDSYKMLKLFKGQLSGGIDYHSNNYENGLNYSDSNIEKYLNSSKSKSSFLLKWLKKQQMFRQHHLSNNYSKHNQTAFLEPELKWLKLRIKISEGRLFIYKDNKEREDEGEIHKDKNYRKKDYFIINLFDCTAELLQTNIVIGKQNGSSNANNINYNININIPYNGVDHQNIINNNNNNNNKTIILQFRTKNKDKAYYVVKCINFWASRISSIPDSQFELVSNEEYGWSNKILSSLSLLPEHDITKLNQINISEWKPLLSTLDIFDMDEEEEELQDEKSYLMAGNNQKLEEKLCELKGFINRLDELIDEHNQIKPSIIEIWNETKQFDKVMNNWNNKYLFLNNQYQRQLIYYKTLNESYSKYCVSMKSDSH